MSDKTEYDLNIDKIVAIMNAKHAFYTQVPETEPLIEILKIRFNEEDAAICANMSIFPVGEDAGTIADKLHMKNDELLPVLDRLIERGLVFRSGEAGAYTYCLHSLEPGLIMTSFSKGEDSKETRALAVAFNEYIDSGGMGQTYRSSAIPFLRVIPIEKNIEGEQVVLPYEKMSELLESVPYYAVAHCQCKTSKKLVNEPCTHGPETEHCLLFGEFAKTFAETGYAREITKEEAYAIVKRTQDLGLVHLTVNTRNEFLSICNCCSCCCFMLRSFLNFDDAKAPGVWAPSEFFAIVQRDVCDGCKDLAEPICIGKCPMNAISLKDGRALVNAGKCIGCGICGYACPIEGAVILKRKKQKGEEPPERLADLITNVIASH